MTTMSLSLEKQVLCQHACKCSLGVRGQDFQKRTCSSLHVSMSSWGRTGVYRGLYPTLGHFISNIMLT